MSETNVQEPEVKTQEERKYTPEEIKKMRDNMIKHYKGEITVLKTQAEYEKLLADIEESKARRYHAMATQAQLFAGTNDEELEQPEEQPQPKARTRQLKTD